MINAANMRKIMEQQEEKIEIHREGFTITITGADVSISDTPGLNVMVELSTLYPLGGLIKAACEEEAWEWLDSFLATMYAFFNVAWDAPGLLDVMRTANVCAARHKELYIPAPLSDEDDAALLQDFKEMDAFTTAVQESQGFLGKLKNLLRRTKK